MNVMEAWTRFGSREGIVLVSCENGDETFSFTKCKAFHA
jgi:hypothetical protein